MKDSGIEWIGLIPQNWKVTKIKHHLKRNEPRNPGNCIVLSLYRELGIVPKDSRDDNHNVTSLDTSNYKYVRIGDFVINKMKAWQGSVAVSDYDGIVSPAYYVYNFLDDVFDKRYFHYLLRSCYKDEFRRLSGGIREGQWDLSSENFDNTLVLIPPLDEQKNIAYQIDKQCAHIDNIIEKTKASIEEYKKLRQAVITQAVTKGVRGDRPMKDSGIEWIGEIPEEWEIIKSWYTMETLGDIDHFMPESTDDGKPYLMIGDLKEQSSEIDFDKCKKISEEDFDKLAVKFRPMKGDIVFARYATIGTVCYVDTDNEFLVSYACVTIRPNVQNMTGKFMYYYFKSSAFIEDIKRFINSNTQGNVGKDSLTKYNMVVPCIEEQKEIADYLDRKCSEIDTIITKKETFLTELDKYKKSLIYECVTGKREVPSA